MPAVEAQHFRLLRPGFGRRLDVGTAPDGDVDGCRDAGIEAVRAFRPNTVLVVIGLADLSPRDRQEANRETFLIAASRLINARAVPPGSIESVLFGHEQGGLPPAPGVVQDHRLRRFLDLLTEPLERHRL